MWRAIPEAYKRKYARNIWEQFEANVRNAAYTSSLSRFYADLCARLDIRIAASDSTGVAQFLHETDGRAALRLLRDETTTIVLFVRVRNEERKAEYKQRKQQEGSEDADLLI